MHVIKVRNVQQAYQLGLKYIQQAGTPEQSRQGPVLVAPGPVTTVYLHPDERVLLDVKRDCNPFFHLMEAIWMLAGRDDVASMKYYVKRMESFSDDKERFHAAYGHRWRKHFASDQLIGIINELRSNRGSRRAVLGMWDPSADLNKNGLDFPCNTSCFFRVRENPENEGRNYLDMTICNRSNDIIWGAYGANAVHMSIMMEFVAMMVGVEVGIMYQVSNNYHAYQETLEGVLPTGSKWDKYGATYARGTTRKTPLFNDHLAFIEPEEALRIVEFWWDMKEPLAHDETAVWEMLHSVFTAPGLRAMDRLRAAWGEWKQEVPKFVKVKRALEHLPEEDEGDWYVAARQWLKRKVQK